MPRIWTVTKWYYQDAKSLELALRNRDKWINRHDKTCQWREIYASYAIAVEWRKLRTMK